MDYQYHEVANIFPLLDGAEFDQLKNDIAKNGQLEPIWLHPDDSSIIDGRNRYRACKALGIEPKFRTWDGEGSLVNFVVSLNLHRRHLTSSQKAMVAVDIEPILAKEAKARKEQAGKIYGQNHPKEEVVEIFPQPLLMEVSSALNTISQEFNRAVSGTFLGGKSRDEAAAIVGTNGRYVQDAKKITQVAPDLAEQVKSGEITIPQAKREIVKRERKEVPELPDSKYRVLYADPPWEYGNSGVINDDNYGRAERHYPTMTISQLCNLGERIKDITEDQAVMFLWVTSPLLEDAFSIVKSWGFKYKTSFVWDKVKHNFGHYNSVRHEFLLVCTRGSCTPDNLKLFDSVQAIEKTNKHSEKPQEFREIIDTIYPYGKRLELFSRVNPENWDTWGNEPE